MGKVVGLISKMAGTTFMSRPSSATGKGKYTLMKHVILILFCVVDITFGTDIYVSSSDYLRLLE